MEKIPIEVRIENLKSIVEPVPDEIIYPVVDTREFVQKCVEHHNELKKNSSHRISSRISSLETGGDVSVYIFGSERDWYPAQVACVKNSNFCHAIWLTPIFFRMSFKNKPILVS